MGIRVIKELSMNGMASTLWAANNLCNQKFSRRPVEFGVWKFFLGNFIKTENNCAPKPLKYLCQPQNQLFKLTTSRKLNYEGRPNWHHLIIITPRQQSTLNPFPLTWIAVIKFPISIHRSLQNYAFRIKGHRTQRQQIFVLAIVNNC